MALGKILSPPQEGFFSIPPCLSHLCLLLAQPQHSTWPLTPLSMSAQALSSHPQRPSCGGSPTPATSDELQAPGEASEVVRSNSSALGLVLGWASMEEPLRTRTRMQAPAPVLRWGESRGRPNNATLTAHVFHARCWANPTPIMSFINLN